MIFFQVIDRSGNFWFVRVIWKRLQKSGIWKINSYGSHWKIYIFCLTLLYSKRPKLYTILAFLSAIGIRGRDVLPIEIAQAHLLAHLGLLLKKNLLLYE